MTLLFQDNNDSTKKKKHNEKERKERNPKQAPPSSFGQAAKSYYRFNPIKTFPGLSLLWSFS